ncbi:hypothetical protein LshimejAT787_0409360 [Lyophyllum shimeji]|uniref:Uncharacterized protein n=1 Tax=Lyophyllum shimeji TaxID=47721 RepID=A0A9P3UNI4_LYOSH|nr:hypothetical protein LshimejAT787_0409360 [Lyophyllum shimeji]
MSKTFSSISKAVNMKEDRSGPDWILPEHSALDAHRYRCHPRRAEHRSSIGDGDWNDSLRAMTHVTTRIYELPRVQRNVWPVRATSPKRYHTVGRLEPGGTVDVVFQSDELSSDASWEDTFLIDSRLVPVTPLQRFSAIMGFSRAYRRELAIQYRPEKSESFASDEQNLKPKTDSGAYQSKTDLESSDPSAAPQDRRPGVSMAELQKMRSYLAQDAACTNAALYAPPRIVQKCFDFAEARVAELDAQYQVASRALRVLRQCPDSVDLDDAAKMVPQTPIPEDAAEALQPALERWIMATEVFRLEAVLGDISSELKAISESGLMASLRAEGLRPSGGHDWNPHHRRWDVPSLFKCFLSMSMVVCFQQGRCDRAAFLKHGCMIQDAAWNGVRN